MKQYFSKNYLIYVFIVLIGIVFIFGGMYSRYMTRQIDVHAEEQTGITLEAFEFNFDTTTFMQFPYLAKVKYGSPSTLGYVYLSPQFVVGGVVPGTEITADLLTNLQELVDTTALRIDTSVYFTEFNAATNTVTVATHGFHDIIEVTVTFNSTYSNVTDYSVSSNESYFFEHQYSGGPVPAVENYYMDGFVAGSTNLDAVVGASDGTSPAMQRIVDLLDGFQTHQLLSALATVVYGGVANE